MKPPIVSFAFQRVDEWRIGRMKTPECATFHLFGE